MTVIVKNLQGVGMINLIFGCAGSGKTSRILQEIKNSISQCKRTYLLVPEQQVFTAESMLAELHDSAGLYFEVISFSRLCELVFGQFGGISYTSVTGGMRNLIMWKSIRQVSPILSNYSGTIPDASLAGLMLATADELRANSISEKDIEAAIERTKKNDIRDKLSDINAVISAYNANLKSALGEGAVAAENKLERLYDCLCDNNFFKGADVFVDSFTDFTGIQHKILEQIMKQADNMYISVYSRERGYHASHNKSIVEAIKKLTRAARDSGRDFGDITLGGNVRTHSPQLKLLEKHLWDFTAQKDTLPEIPEELSHDIEMIECENEYEETECAALKILEARQNRMKYSDIAVIMRNPEERSGIINAVFSKYNIPYFISEKTQITSTPAARFILSSLRCVARNYRLNDVLTLLKTGLCGIDDKDADMFEEYCLAWNIQGDIFTSSVWNMNPSGYVKMRSQRDLDILEAANKVRAALISPLEELKVKMKAAGGDAAELCRALYSYMEHHKLSARLCDLAELELELGNVKDAGEILRVYDLLVSTLSEICYALSDHTLTPDDLMTAIEIMLSGTEIASVPSMSECVTIGSAATLRVEGIKLGIVMGLCEGVFPSVPKDAGLLSESDKEAITDETITFKARREKLMSDELFYVYRAMTTPSEKLIATTYSSSISGGSVTPSTPWRRLITLFDIPVEKFNGKAVRALSEHQINLAETEALEQHKREYFGENLTVEDTIPSEKLQSILGNTLYLSKTKIQNFVKCPMLYWSKHMLDLRPRDIAQVSAAESGTLIHYVLENLFREIRLYDGSLPTNTSSQILSLTNKWVDQYITETKCPKTPATMFAFSKLRNMAYLMANNVSEEFSMSDFKMFSFEQKISNFGENTLKPFEITLNSIKNTPTVYLGGEADRVDTYTKDGITYVRVIDYKTGKVSFNEENVISGADLQLPAYLFAIASEKNKAAFGDSHTILPGASLYLSAVESAGDISIARSGMIYNGEDFLAATNKNLDYNYISTAAANAAQKDELDSCSELYSEEKISEMKDILTGTVENTANQIFSGVAKRTPSAQSCKYCPIRQSCPVAVKSKY